MSDDYKVCVRDEYGEFDSWEAWQKFHRDRKDIDRLSEYANALKEENKRLRNGLGWVDQVLSALNDGDPVSGGELDSLHGWVRSNALKEE